MIMKHLPTIIIITHAINVYHVCLYNATNVNNNMIVKHLPTIITTHAINVYIT